jgi:hypothetical protein
VTLPNGWTVHEVPRRDVALEGELMGNCLRDGELWTPGRLLSLRDPEGAPQVTLEVYDGLVMRAEARFRASPTEEHRSMLAFAFGEAGLGAFVVARCAHWGRELWV